MSRIYLRVEYTNPDPSKVESMLKRRREREPKAEFGLRTVVRKDDPKQIRRPVVVRILRRG